MITIAMVATKGGSSKSTLATNLAALAVAEDRAAVIIDLDSQKSAFKWGSIRRGAPPEVLLGTPKTLWAMLDAARKHGADFVFVDTRGHASEPVAVAAQHADLVLVPCRTSAADVLAVAEETLPLLKAADALSKSRAVLVAPHMKSREIAEAESILDDLGLRTLSKPITELQIYRDAFRDGQGVVEADPGSTAAGQIRALWGAIAETVARLKKKEVIRG